MLKYLRSIKYPFKANELKSSEGLCCACGASTAFEYFDVINDRLAEEWEINDRLKKAYSERESMHCTKCRCSTRLRSLALAVSIVYADKDKSLKENIKNGEFDDTNVAEINSCGDLHNILKDIKSLEYSEYAGRVKGVRDEDLQNLTYKNNSFDLVLTSDTLEHVPDYMKALAEIKRVLKEDGYHIFTIPLIFSRKTRRRIKIEGDKIINILEPSYHGAGEADNLVCTEFGIDFLDEINSLGFKTEIYFANPLNKNEVNYVFVTRKID